jgi:uncharacterized protein YndB with AHSA1/START domain
MAQQLTVQSTIDAPIEKVWKYYTNPEHMTHWNFASDDWQCPHAENDLRIGGKFKSRMEARDGSSGFDFEGTYTAVEQFSRIEYIMAGDDSRKVAVEFRKEDDGTLVKVAFDPENINPLEMQKSGWQAILNNFKKYVEQSQNAS